MTKLFTLLALLSSSTSLACMDFTGWYECPTWSVEIHQTQCDWIKFHEINRSGLHTYTTIKTDGIFHEYRPAPHVVAGYAMASHTDTSLHYYRTWSGPGGAQTRKSVLSFTEEGNLNIAQVVAYNEFDPPYVYNDLCVVK